MRVDLRHEKKETQDIFSVHVQYEPIGVLEKKSKCCVDARAKIKISRSNDKFNMFQYVTKCTT